MSQKLRQWIVLADFLWIPLALLLAYSCHYRVADSTSVRLCLQSYRAALIASLLLWAFISLKRDLHGFRGGWSLPAILSQVVVGLTLLMMGLLTLSFLTKQVYSRLVLVYFSFSLLVGFVGIRCLARLLVDSRSRGGGKRKVVILGNGHVAREIASKILRHPETMWELVGFLFPSGTEFSAVQPPREFSAVPTMGALDLLTRNGVHELIVTVSPAANEVRKLIGECRGRGMRVILVPQLYELYVSQTRLLEIDGLPLLSLEQSFPSTASLQLKRLSDIILSSLLLILVAPVLLLAAAALYLHKGSAFRREWHGGKDGKPFWMYRLNIDRNTKAGKEYERLLDHLSITELPQLWNVLRGDMSLVGPRPEPMERVKHYSDWQRQRLRMPAGLTGLAQVYGLRQQHSSEEKARFDLQYIFQWSLFTDFALLLQTLWTLIIRLGKSRSVARFDFSPSEASPKVSPSMVAEVSDANRA